MIPLNRVFARYKYVTYLLTYLVIMQSRSRYLHHFFETFTIKKISDFTQVYRRLHGSIDNIRISFNHQLYLSFAVFEIRALVYEFIHDFVYDLELWT